MLTLDSPRELRFEVNGHIIAAKAWGDASAPLVIALHGWLDNAATWNMLAPQLENTYLLSLDLMGHGYSDHRPASMPYYIWDNVLDLVAVSDQLEQQTFSLLGHSMGASIATLFAGAFPKRVERLMLIEGIAPLVTEPEDVAQQMALAIQKRKRLLNKRQRPYPDLESAVSARVNGRWPVSEQAARWLVERSIIQKQDGFYWRSDPSLTLPSVMRMSEAQVESFIVAVSAPVLLILGKQGIVQSDRRIDLFRTIDRYQIAGGHHLHLEQQAATEIAKLINDFNC